MTLSGAIAPGLTDAWLQRLLFRAQQGAPVDDLQDGNLESPSGPHLATGTQARAPLRRSAYTRAALSDLSRVLPLMAAAVAMTAAYRLWSAERAPAQWMVARQPGAVPPGAEHLAYTAPR